MNRIFALTSITLTFLSAGIPVSASMMDEFIDPQDGMFDTSHWLAERKGFFPMPIIITEPAVGFGLGAGLLFLHDPLAGKTADANVPAPDPIPGGLLGLYCRNPENFLAR